MKSCRDCAVAETPGQEFYKNSPYCKPCHYTRSKKYREQNRDRVREWQRAWAERNPHHPRQQRLKRYGLTFETFDALLAAQGGVCAVCGTTEPGGRFNNWHIDHDHACCAEPERSCGECVRGLLCSRCNMALGLLGDSPTTLGRAIAYLAGARADL